MAGQSPPQSRAANHGGLLPIFKRLINCCWFWAKWCLLLGGIAAAVVAFYVHDRIDEEIRCRVIEKIAEHYRGLRVTARSAGRVEDGLEVRGLAIVDPGTAGPRAELLYCDEIIIGCTTDLQELIAGSPEIREITIRRAKLSATRRPDGTWSTSLLFPFPQLSQRPPKLTIENGTIEIYDEARNLPGTLTLRQVNLTLHAADPSGAAPKARKLTGTLSGDYLERVELEGLIDAAGQTWTLSGTVDGLDVSPEMRHALPQPLPARLAVLGDFRGQSTLSFQVAHDAAASSPYSFDVSGRLAQGRLNDSRLPHPLTDIRAKFQLNDAGLAIDELFARSGQTTVRMPWVRQVGFELGRSPLGLAAEIRNLQLDQELRDRLSESLQGHWDKYRPTGRVNANVELQFDGQRWQPKLAVECLDVSFTHHKFNYRLDRWKGNVTLEDDVLDVHLTTTGRNRRVRITGRTFEVSRGGRGWVEAEGTGLELDDKLLDALPGKSRQVVASLNPHGTIDSFLLRLNRDVPGGPLRKDLWLGLKACSIRYDKFYYPIGDIHGTIEMHDDHWTFGGLRGRNDTGWVICEQGSITPPAQGQELFLRLRGEGIQLEPELREALPANVRRLWNGLRPQGTVDLVTDVRYRCPTKQLSVAARIGMGVPLQSRPNAAAAGVPSAVELSANPVSINPVYFPYRMENLQGVLEYRDGFVTLHPFRARHGRVAIAGKGHCDFRNDGSWDFQLKEITVDQLHLRDPELIEAVPQRLKKAILSLNPSGPVHLRGSFSLQGPARMGDPVRAGWDLAIDLHQGAIDPGIALKNINGRLTLAGGFDGRRFHSRGELDIDSLTYKDYQFTELRGPVWIDDHQALFGSWVAWRRNQAAAPNTREQPRTLTARLFGGVVTCDPWITFSDPPRYALHATLSEAALSRCAQEVLVGRQELKGRVFATLDLGGAGRSLNALSGRGTVRLRDADVYDLPLMLALLKILSIRRPDTTAFSKSDVQFRVQGNHIYLERIDFNGDAISLLGQGEMDFQHNIALTFHAVVGSDEVRVPVLRELVGGASQQIMQIRVDGTLQNPHTEKVAFPAVNQALQQLQGDLQRRAHSPGLFPQAQRPAPYPGRGGRYLR